MLSWRGGRLRRQTADGGDKTRAKIGPTTNSLSPLANRCQKSILHRNMKKENIEDTGLILIENCLIRKLINCQLSWISLFATTLTACLKSWLAECKPLSDVGLVTWYVFMEVTWPVGCTMKNSLGGGNHEVLVWTNPEGFWMLANFRMWLINRESSCHIFSISPVDSLKLVKIQIHLDSFKLAPC